MRPEKELTGVTKLVRKNKKVAYVLLIVSVLVIIFSIILAMKSTESNSQNPHVNRTTR